MHNNHWSSLGAQADLPRDPDFEACCCSCECSSPFRRFARRVSGRRGHVGPVLSLSFKFYLYKTVRVYHDEGGECDSCLFCECLHLFSGSDSESVRQMPPSDKCRRYPSAPLIFLGKCSCNNFRFFHTIVDDK